MMLIRNTAKNFFWIGMGISIVLIFFYIPSLINKRFGGASVIYVAGPPPPYAGEAPEELTLLFVGDIMLDRGIKEVVEKKGGGDYHFPFAFVQDEISRADAAFGNLEGPMSSRGERLGSEYSFRMDLFGTGALSDVGFDALSLANNHAGDYGRDALEDTLVYLTTVGILPVGAGWDKIDAYAPKILQKNGKKIAFLAFSDVGPVWLEAQENVSGIALADRKLIMDAIRQARAKADILIVSFHFGEEYRKEPTDRQKELARSVIDAGALLVVGHHPHVAEPVERYNGGIIAYSLGNFIFDQAFSEDTKNAIALRVTIRENMIQRAEILEISFNELFQPQIQEQNDLP